MRPAMTPDACTGVAERKAKLVKKSLNAGQQDFAARRQVASRAESLEQLGAQAPFERAERLRHARLRQIDHLGGAAHASATATKTRSWRTEGMS